MRRRVRFIIRPKIALWMKTKLPCDFTSELLQGPAHPIVQVFFEIAQLKNLYRQGWLRNGVSERHCESVADHCFGVAMIGYVIARE